MKTCRYGLNGILVEERLCESCQVVEDEFLVIMVYPLFNDIRSQYILQLLEAEQSFNDYTQVEQFIYVMSNPACYKIISKTIYFILSKKTPNALQMIMFFFPFYPTLLQVNMFTHFVFTCVS